MISQPFVGSLNPSHGWSPGPGFSAPQLGVHMALLGTDRLIGREKAAVDDVIGSVPTSKAETGVLDQSQCSELVAQGQRSGG